MGVTGRGRKGCVQDSRGRQEWVCDVRGKNEVFIEWLGKTRAPKMAKEESYELRVAQERQDCG